MFKEEMSFGLGLYIKPKVELITLPQNLSFLEESFSGTFQPDDLDLDGMEGDIDDNL